MKKIIVVVLLLLLISCTLDSKIDLIASEKVTYLPFVTTFKKEVGIVTESPISSYWYNPNTAIKFSVRGADVLNSPYYDNWLKSDNIIEGYNAKIIVVTTAPGWMAKDNIICKLPKFEYVYRYKEFIQDVIDRYKPTYIEIWNEPDIRYEAMPPEHAYFYGCIGDGKEYGEFTDYIKNNVTGAKILIGSLANPYTPFISDMLVGDYDGISFHCYNRFYGVLYGNCVLDYKQVKLYTNKEVLLTETAVLYRSGLESKYEEAQIIHYKQLKELNTFYWYTLCGNGWPIEMPTDLCKRPVFNYYKRE